MSGSDYRFRREIQLTYRQHHRLQVDVGQDILWYQIDYEQTTKDPIYDTGPSRAWQAPVVVKALHTGVSFATKTEDSETDGLYLVDTIAMTLSAEAFMRAGFKSLLAHDHHLNDRIRFDNQIYTITKFAPGGRIGDSYLFVAVTGTQVKPEELAEDVEFWYGPGTGIQGAIPEGGLFT